MKSTGSLRVDTNLLLPLIEQRHRLGGTQDSSAGITAAIACWLDQGAEAPPVADPAYPRGCQWKSPFLPRARCGAPGAMANTKRLR